MKKISMLIICMMVLGSVTAFAGVCPKTDAWIEDKVHHEEYGIKVFGMLADGVNRIVAAPFELGEHTVRGTMDSESNPVIGLFEGVFTGMYEAGRSIGIGVTNIALAVVPDYHGLSKDYTFLDR